MSKPVCPECGETIDEHSRREWMNCQGEYYDGF